MTPIANPAMLPVGTELIYQGSDMDWHYARVVRVDADSIIADMPTGTHRVSFESLTNPEHWRHR